MLNLSSLAIIEKNKLTSTGAWLIMLQLDVDDTTIRVVHNNEDIVWPTGGNVWQAFPFSLGEVREDTKGTLPSFSIKVSNVTRALVPYLEATEGFKNGTVRLLVVHSEHLNLITPEIDETFDIQSVSVNEMWVTINVGAENPMRMRSPRDRYLKDCCRFKFKSTLCGYSGTATNCDKTFGQCKQRGNSTRYGGFPGVDGGVYV